MSSKASPDLSKSQARWLARRTIVWPPCALPDGLRPTDLDWRLHWSPAAGIDPWASEPWPWSSAPLRPAGTPLPRSLAARFPAARDAVVLDVPADLDLDTILRGQVVVVVQQPSGRLINASGVQLAGVLDEVYADAARADLGLTFTDGVPTLRVWAPTALDASLLLIGSDDPPDAEPAVLPLTREPDGCWSVTGEPSWTGCRYLYSVTVFDPGLQRVVTTRVTDPYSVALAENSTASVIVDLDDPALAPQPWLDQPQPTLATLVDQVSYELHVRDFSISDASVAPDLRGTYRAFTQDSAGTRHLRRLAEAGLNTVQLMPIFDFTSSEDHRGRQSPLDLSLLGTMAPDSDRQQAYLRENNLHRSFNWGYDPWHSFVPEGSYATPGAVEGGGRIREVREMIGAIHGLGLRVVLDQVFNHTNAAGQSASSVLGRIVPGYYHRLDAVGDVYTSTCCPNVATEHRMAEKLMVDACVLWAKHYKVDGFRFDLMGHHSRANMLKVRAALDALTIERDGVDGRQVTMYGEGWIFGEVADNALFVQASQGQLGGTGVATFSDRMRDAVRGGGPFDADPRLQGFGTGLATAPNASQGNGNRFDQGDRLLHDADLIQLGLAGTLRDYTFTSQRYATPLRGDKVDYNGGPAGYADTPADVVNYVDAHDNETLFDALTLKLPVTTTMADRVRMNTVCLAFPTLGQSAVMWHAGSDFLRSKSLDRNSYDSGDWFNLLDFSLIDNGFGRGLPPASNNVDKWPYLRPLLAMPQLKPAPGDMRAAHAQALDLLRLRSSSRLFRLGDAAAIRAKVTFPVSGTWAQIPGVIVMVLDDTVGRPVDAQFARIAVVFNAATWPVRQVVETLPGAWELHPVQQGGADPIVKTTFYEAGAFRVPGRTVAVFVERRG
ncbi:MAG TPA: pullulanase-type alpha-1,6-glucosidase [Propioniciclava tarda]|nr:pullulanase-type alpha-1,6-glucosidase [Propioniciclava tarda]